MAEKAAPLIASAVIVPEAAEVEAEVQSQALERAQETTTNGATKRRQSFDGDDTTTYPKRPRLNNTGPPSPSSTSTPQAHSQSQSQASPGTTATPATTVTSSTSKPTRQRTLSDPKSRNKRLFGGLLSTLSASSRSSRTEAATISRRLEIESRQQEKLRLQARDTETRRGSGQYQNGNGEDAYGRRGRDMNSEEKEEREEDERRSRAELQRRRERQTIEWDAYGSRVKQENSRAMARALRTKTEPVLYFRPYKLLPEQEVQVEKQVQEAEEVVVRDEEDAARSRKEQATGKSTEDDESTAHTESDVPQNQGMDMTAQDRTAEQPGAEASASGAQLNTDAGALEQQNPAQSEETAREIIDDNDAEELMVDAGEDAVIY